jgi:glucose/arabinose dehydrogenase
MRSKQICVAFTALVYASFDPALACPPSKTWTTGPDDEAGFVLAEGALAAARTAGPFEVPWSVALLPDGSFLVTERPGRLQHVRTNADTIAVQNTPSVFYVGHGGLLDVAVDPEFEESRFIYLSYLQGNETASTIRVLRAKFDEDNDTLTDEAIIFEGSPGPRPEQIGGRVALTGDGYLFVSLGDRWEPARAQDLSDTAGSIVRIKTDGTVPEDNPSERRRAPGRRSGATATAIRKALPSIAPPVSSGPTSMGRKAATSSISSCAAAITAGPSPPSASTMKAIRSR